MGLDLERRAGAAGVGHYVPEFDRRSCAGAAGAAGVGAVAAEAEHGGDGEPAGGASAGIESAALLHYWRRLSPVGEDSGSQLRHPASLPHHDVRRLPCARALCKLNTLPSSVRGDFRG